jgi:hypothetical protein
VTHPIENAQRPPVRIASKSAFGILQSPSLLWHNQSLVPSSAEGWLWSYKLHPCQRRPTKIGAPNTAEVTFYSQMKQPAPPSVLPFALMPRTAVLDFAKRSCRKKIFCRDWRSVELRASCNDSPRTPPGPEGSNGNGSTSCAAEYPKFLSSHQRLPRATGKASSWATK